MAFLPPIKMLVAMLILPLAMGQMGAPTNLQSMSYSIVNGKVFVDPPTTPAPTFMETWFPWLTSSYTSSNPEEIDEAIINSVTGPPEPQQSINLHQNSGGGMYSNYQQQQQQQPSGYNSYNQNQSPYLSNEEDNYIPSSSLNAPQYVGMDGNYSPGYPNQNHNQIPSNQYQQQGHQIHYFPAQNAPYGNGLPPLPYPFSALPGQPTTESSAPFYQPILDFFGFGASSLDDQLQLPFPGLGGQLPEEVDFQSQIPSFPQSSFQFIPPQFAQARKSVEDGNFKYVDSYEPEQGKYSVHNGPKSGGHLKIVRSDKKEEEEVDNEKNPCPKLGFWHWNGEVCIALGPVPVWACKPNDLVMSGRVGVCRNKIFFSPGTKPLQDRKK